MNAYQKEIDRLLSHISTIETQVADWKKSWQETDAMLKKAEERVKELEEGIEKHRNICHHQNGGFEPYDQELYKLIKSERG